MDNNRRQHTLLSVNTDDRLLTNRYTVYGIQFWVFHSDLFLVKNTYFERLRNLLSFKSHAVPLFPWSTLNVAEYDKIYSVKQQVSYAT